MEAPPWSDGAACVIVALPAVWAAFLTYYGGFLIIFLLAFTGLEALHRWPDTDAIYAICDTVAFGAIVALRGLGVDVPDDVAVAGFDDVPAAAWTGPALTTATHPVSRIAAGAATAVLNETRVPSATWYRSELVLLESA